MNRRSIVAGIVALCGGLVGACADSAATIGPDPDSVADGGTYSTTLPDGGETADAAVPEGRDDGGALSPGDDVSGTRLKARRYVGDDGARQFRGWYDSHLRVTCGFQTASDGVVRCIPDTPTTGQIYYADAKCSELLLYGSKGCDAGKYGAVGVFNLTKCVGAYMVKVTQVGAPFTGASVYVGTPQSCSSTPASSVYDFYRAGPEVPPSTFVKATEQVD